MNLTRLLKLGCTGPDVGALQAGLFIDTDEKFGPQTEAAVRDYQESHKLTVDGVVGPRTWESIMAARPLPNPKLDAVGRLVRFAGEGKYILGGSASPNAATPWSWVGAQRGADCVGGVLWALGCKRHDDSFPEYEGDINTDSMLMDAGLCGLGGKGAQAFFSPLTGPMHPGVIVVYRSVWRKDMPMDWRQANPGNESTMVAMGHTALIAGWTGLKDPEHPEDSPWDMQLATLVTVEVCLRFPACRLGHNVNFLARAVHGIVNPDWQPQFITFHGPSVLS